MNDLLSLYDLTYNKLCILNDNSLYSARNITETHKINSISTLSFEMPLQSDKWKYIINNNLVEWKDELYKISNLDFTHSNEKRSVTIQCNHMSSGLEGMVCSEFKLVGKTAKELMTNVLNRTTIITDDAGNITDSADFPSNWSVGIIDIPDTVFRSLETSKDQSVFANLVKIAETFQATLYFHARVDIKDNMVINQVDLIQTKLDRQIQIRKGKNLKSVNVVYGSDSPIVTRLFAFGGSDEVTQQEVNIMGAYEVDENGNKTDIIHDDSYLEDNSWYTAQGYDLDFIHEHPELFLYEQVWRDSVYLDSQDLLEDAYKKLKTISKPQVKCKVEGLDLSIFPEYFTASPTIGEVVYIIDEDLNLSLQAQVVEISKNSQNPLAMSISISNEVEYNSILNTLTDTSKITKKNTTGSGLIRGTYIENASIDNAKIKDATITSAKIDSLDAGKITTGTMQADRISGGILTLGGGENGNGVASIKDLDSNEIVKLDNKGINITNGKITIKNANGTTVIDESGVNGSAIINGSIDGNVVEIKNLNANNITTGTITADKMTTGTITAESGVIGSLDASKITTGTLDASKATITNLNADNIVTGTLKGDLIEGGTITADKLMANTITAGSGVIAEGAIGNGHISNLQADKISSGTVNTSKVTIQGANARMKISGNRLQVFDTKEDLSLYERVSLGDVDGDGSVYGFRVRGADGTTVLLDENGVKREGITDGSINNSKISDDANIDGSKLDIASVVTEINDGTETISGNKILLNNKTLDVEFSEIKTTQTSQGQTISNHSSQITALSDEIKTKVSSQTYNTFESNYNNFVSSTTQELIDIQSQIDGNITNWFYDGVPTLSNLPASLWTTNEVKNVHLGDLYYDNLTGHVYRFRLNVSIYEWFQIKDSDVTKALSDAKKAQDTADGKRRVFTSTPIPPYDLGDLWSQGSTGDLMKCKIAKTTGQTYSSGDWEKASKYTDDTKANEVSSRLTTAESTITQHSNQIAMKVTQTEIDNSINAIQVGGRNLVLNSAFDYYLESWSKWGNTPVAEVINEVNYPSIRKAVHIKTAFGSQGITSKNFKIVGGKTYTLSYDALIVTGNCGIELRLMGLNKETQWRQYFANVSTEYKKQIFIINIPEGYDTVSVRVGTGGSEDSPNVTEFFLTNIKFEEGNKASSWTPAIEDIDNAISNVQSSADTANNLLSDIVNDSKLTPNEKTNIKKEWDIIVAERPTIEAQATTYGVLTEKTNYINAYNTLNTYITPLTSDLTTTADIVGSTFRNNFKTYYDSKVKLLKAISDKSKSLTDEVTSRLTTAESEIVQHSNQIALKVTQTEVDNSIGNIQIGGRNLIRNTKDTFQQTTLYAWTANLTPITPLENIGLKIGDTITLSFYLRCLGNGGGSARLSFYKADGTYSSSSSPNFILPYTEGWTTHTYVVPNGTTGVALLVQRQNAKEGLLGVLIEYKNLKLEKGNKVTDWTPAPEDTQSQIDDATSRISTAESSIVQNADNINLKVSKNNVISEINQSAEAVKISASKIDINGAVTFNSFDNSTQTMINNGNTAKSTIDANKSKWDSAESNAKDYTNSINKLLNIDNTQSTLFHFDKNLCATNGANPVGSYVATLRQNEGKFGGCVAVEEGTTNLFTHKIDNSFLVKAGKPYSVLSFTNENTSYRYDFIGENTLVYEGWDITVDTTKQYTLSGWMYVSEECSASTNPRIKGEQGFSQSLGYDFSKKGTWQYLSCTAFPTTTNARILMYANTSATGVTGGYVIYKNIQFEQKSFATSFVNGTRASGSLNYGSNLNLTNNFTVLAWVNMSEPDAINSYYHKNSLVYLYDTISTNNDSMALYIRRYMNSSTPPTMAVWVGNPATWFTSSVRIPQNQWVQVGYSYDGSKINLYLNGVKMTNYSLTRNMNKIVKLIVGGTGDEFCNGLIDDLYINTNKTLTDSEIKTIYDLQQPFYDPNPIVTTPKPSSVTISLS